MSTDPEKAEAFYTEFLGWKADPMEMVPGFTYRTFNVEAGPFAGCVPLEAGQGIPSHWIPYIGCDDCDATCAKATELGGKVCVAPTDIPNIGRFAVVEDPSGGFFSPFTKNDDVPPEPEEPIPFTICWNELMTKDPDAAIAFYEGLFGWTHTSQEMDLGNDIKGTYYIFMRGECMTGGCMQLPPEAVAGGAPSHWMAYILVDDVDASHAKVKELGATEYVAPSDIPGIGRFSVLAGTAGAAFALFIGSPDGQG